MKSDAFRAAAEGKDFSGAGEILAPDVVFHSPVVFRPYEGRDALLAVLSAVVRVFEDFRYVDQVEADDIAVLVFKARIAERELDGVDLLRFDAEGRVRELTVMVRPMSATRALAEAMARLLEEAAR